LTSLALTSTAIVSASFLLGVLFTSVLWDGSILYASSPVTEATVEAVENYYLTWWNGAMTVKAFLHIVVSPSVSPRTGRVGSGCRPTPLLGQVFALFMSLVAKFARYTETAYYFSGASLGASRGLAIRDGRDAVDNFLVQSSWCSTPRCTL
jgi:hypothetical protein